MKISDEVLGVLSTLEIDAPYVRITRQLDRKLYTKVNQALEACGGEWNRKAKAHLFDGDVQARIDRVITTGEVTTDQDLGFFPTPLDLARQLVEMADVRPGHIVLEPSAGEGAIVRAILEREANVVCIERELLRRDILIGLERRHGRVGVLDSVDDFMEYSPTEPFDRVVMNPPFCKIGLGDHLDHVRHAFGMLVPGGILVSVLPNGVLFRQDKRHVEFRTWAMREGYNGIGRFDELPEDSFKASGTGVRTCVLRMAKP